jgi:hypothetical protein
LNGVSTFSTPGARSAALVSIAVMRARATVLVIITACATRSTGISAAYFAPPVTLRRPSIRSSGRPMLESLGAVTPSPP